MDDSISLHPSPFSPAGWSVFQSPQIDPGRQIANALVASDLRSVRQRIREHKARTGQALTFAGFIASNLDHSADVHTRSNPTERLVSSLRAVPS